MAKRKKTKRKDMGNLPDPKTMDREDLERELRNLRKLEEYLRYIVEDEGPGAGGLSHAQDCNTIMGWGEDTPCDCYVADVYQALDKLDETALGQIVDALTPANEDEARISELEDFVREIRDGYDCDTGANGVHAYRCRCCVAGDLLGYPPSVFDPRPRGG